MARQLRLRFGAEARILIIDRDDKNANDRSWAFWSAAQLPLGLDRIVRHEWAEVRFRAPGWERTSAIGPYRYRLIRGLDYYNFMQDQLRECPNTAFLRADAGRVGEDELGPWIEVGADLYRAQWIFDSRVRPPAPTAKAGYQLWQHFRGWRIKVDRPVFSPQAATLMDFSENTTGEATFFYCLPFSETEALIEFTVFSERSWEREAYEHQLVQYLKQRLGAADYTILEEESGCIPMTDQDLADRRFQRIRSIGTAGNAVKPTTGYAFLRIQRQVATMAKALQQTGMVPHAEQPTDRFRWYDHLLLYLLQHEPQRGRDIFTALFKSQPYDRILRFLDEDTRWWEEALIFKSLPTRWFLEAAWNHHLRCTSPHQQPFPLIKKTQYG